MMSRLSVLVAASVFAATAYAQHSHSASASAGQGPTMKTEIDNDTVQVVRIHIDPRQKIPTHDVTPRVVVWLTDAHLRATLPDGSSRDERATAGEIEWVPRGRHAAENLDDHPVEFVAVIPKAAGLGSGK